MKTKSLLASAFLLLCAHAQAGTYTWTGAAGDGLWFTAGNWNHDGAPAATSPGNTLNGDDVIINGAGVVVTYVPGGDLVTQAGTTLTVSGGAKLLQNGGAWPFFHGNVVVDGGTMDFKNNAANPDQVRLDGRLELRNGGQLLSNQLVTSGDNVRIVIGAGVYYEASGTVNGNLYVMDGGTLHVGEYQPHGAFTLSGSGLINCNIFAPQTASDITTFNGPDLIMRTTAYDGFWQGGGTSYIDVPAGSTSKFTVAAGFHTVEDVYPKTFGSDATNPKFRYNGEVITQEQFAELFIVEAHDGAIDGNNWYTDFYLKPTGMVPLTFDGGAVTATLTSDTSATISATVDEAGSPAYTLVAVWGKADGGHHTDAWENALDLGAATANQVVSQAIALESGYAYYYGLAATNENGVIWATPSPASFFAMLNEPGAPTNVWTSAVSTDSRVAGNWSLGHVPAAGEIVYVLDRFHNVRLDWYPGTGTDEVAGWIQPDAFLSPKHQVFFHTAAASPLTITGDVLLGAGTWTCSGPADEPTEIVNVAVGGSMMIGANARIVVGLNENFNNDDGAPRGYTQDHGPGYLREAGGSHAGEGGHIPSATGFVSYGSILNPLSYGSGGHGDNVGYAGGGVVKLSVGGALTMDGVIRSRGFGYPLNEPGTVGGAGSGGSINITAASLAGAGTIDANGGANGLYGPGSGGRVKVALTGAGATFDAFTGTIEAVGGSMQDAGQPGQYDLSPAAAGTVCLQTAGAAPVVKVYNVFRYGNTDAAWRVATDTNAIPSATHLPAMQATDAPVALRTTHWELSGHGAIRLTANCRVASLTIAESTGPQRVYTDGHKLRVNELTIAGKAYDGTLTATDLPGVVFGNGSIVVDDATTLLLFR